MDANAALLELCSALTVDSGGSRSPIAIQKGVNAYVSRWGFLVNKERAEVSCARNTRSIINKSHHEMPIVMAPFSIPKIP